jgi:hypothetical protein
MIIHDRDFRRRAFSPSKHDSPLVVDADGVKSAPAPLERFQSIARRNGEIAEVVCVVELNQFAQGDSSYSGKTAGRFATKQMLGFVVTEGLNHGRSGRAPSSTGELGLILNSSSGGGISGAVVEGFQESEKRKI